MVSRFSCLRSWKHSFLLKFVAYHPSLQGEIWDPLGHCICGNDLLSTSVVHL
jgi:hypothetical protein